MSTQPATPISVSRTKRVVALVSTLFALGVLGVVSSAQVGHSPVILLSEGNTDTGRG